MQEEGVIQKTMELNEENRAELPSQSLEHFTSEPDGEQARKSGSMYLARTRSFPARLFSLGFFTAIFWRFYICCLSYMFSLISQANWERYSRDQSSFKMIYIYDAK